MKMDPVTDVLLRRTASPASEPVTLAEFKAHVHEDLSDISNDVYMTTLLVAAREWCENYTHRAFISQQWTMLRQAWPQDTKIYLDRGPLLSLGAVLYKDSAGVQQTWSSSNYTVSALTNCLQLNRDIVWPTVDTGTDWPISIGYTVGYGTASTVPETIKLAIKQLASFWYEFRHGSVENKVNEQPPEQIKRLLSAYRLPEFH